MRWYQLSGSPSFPQEAFTQDFLVFPTLKLKQSVLVRKTLVMSSIMSTAMVALQCHLLTNMPVAGTRVLEEEVDVSRAFNLEQFRMSILPKPDNLEQYFAKQEIPW